YKGNKDRFPILFLIARDYLGLPPGSAASETEFSKGADIVTKKRNRLLPGTIKQTILLKS
ncbi:uncharacterized protein MYCGRDRAFT_19700, partial [Zymoseptoria tritici IPO323]